MAESKSLAIIGAGTFGLSTALAWRREYPAARISLIDVKPLPPHPPSHPHSPSNPEQIIPASEDVAKIIRAAYTSPAYVRLARDALHAWRTTAPYADFFHASGWVVADARSDVTDTTEDGEKIGRGRFAEGGKKIGRERVAEVFPGSNLEDGYVILEDAEPGWVEASRCLEAVLQMALSQGIEYRAGEAVGLWWQGFRCTGVEMRDGEDIRAENVLLATGPWTPTFLRRCGITASIPCEVAGVTAVGIQLDEDEYRRYKDMPILLVTGAGAGRVGDIMPPDRNRIIKINNATSFHAPDIESRKLSTGNSPYFEENIALLRKFLPALQGAPIAFRRYCFDLETPAQDFIISAVPGIRGLYIAAGGSFHGWKFLPNIGEYVVEVIEGTLPSPWSELWRVGGTPSEEPIHPDVKPARPFI